MASSSRVGPGEKGDIRAKVDTSNRKGMLTKTIDVMSNDPRRPKITLTMKAFVKEPAPPKPSPQQ